MLRAEIFKELLQLKERKLWNFSILKLFVTANNPELGNQFHSFTAKIRIESFVKLSPSLFVLLLLPSSQIKGKIPNFDASLYLYHFYGAI